ncbi:AraC family transcriptional regulator [Caballeronia sp. LP006]|uniref:AraC family transcriptional regulator n=1 Tax=unclassified Caballeronia TaxID=2646786 RepID=UPI001FD3D015|nr:MULTISPECIES: AraC family transcriptional regulator [unclassified Caballeronia]MDR5772397.1 AraC family transcriptional regulator [Caballeronia sp. LZ002]MDR5804158.1 AraC family transcriptional regulator [Caballeronia sp. LZ001]MDR5832009.1 AraC family transcriptional regulator [Caballeronia sp. LP006]MDR5847831.1 AraC family transcriptional regulator [Caballeronia sp. LZ003]
MDALDRLIQLARLSGALDLRCLLAGPLELDHAPGAPGEALYHVVLEGACTVERKGHASVALNAGDIFMLPRADAHVVSVGPVDASEKIGAMTSRDNGAITVRTNVDGREAALDLLCGRFLYAPRALLIDVLPDFVHVSFTNASAPYLGPLVAAMRREAEEAQPGAPSIVTALSTALFTMVLRAWLTEQPSLAGVLGLLANRRLGAAVIAMLERPADPWTLEMLAKEAAMSRATFMRAFSAHSDSSPLALLSHVRMQLASTMLMHTRKSVADVAADVGYQSEAAFSKRFKELYGVAPGRFRQTNGLS